MLEIVDHAAATDVGRVRNANEDSHHVDVPLFVVADGMGGAQAGEVASGLAVETFRAGLDGSLAPEARVADAVQRANHTIFSRSLESEQYQGMGTTTTALLLEDDQLAIGHVGDSRAYRLRDGELLQLTQDHSLVGEMVRRGALTEAEAEVHPQRSILTRALGPEDQVEVDTLSYSARAGDIYLICSDGLTGMVDDATIARTLGSGAPMQQVVDELIRLANAGGGVDNITAVAFRLGGESDPAAEPVSDLTSEQTVVAPAVSTPAAEPPAAAETPAPASTTPQPQTAAASNGRPGAAEREARSRKEFERRRSSTGHRRRWVGGTVIAVVLVLGIAGAIVGSLNVYFIGGNEQGLVTVYRGLPYDLPLSVSLYTRDYVTGTPVSELPPELRTHILDHKLRSRADALDLAQQIDAGKIDTSSVGPAVRKNRGPTAE